MNRLAAYLRNFVVGFINDLGCLSTKGRAFTLVLPTLAATASIYLFATGRWLYGLEWVFDAVVLLLLARSFLRDLIKDRSN